MKCRLRELTATASMARTKSVWPSAPEAAKVGAAIGYRDFLDSHLIGNLIGKQFDAGDVRSILARNLTDDYAATIETSRLIENALEDITPQQVIDQFSTTIINLLPKSKEQINTAKKEFLKNF